MTDDTDKRVEHLVKEVSEIKMAVGLALNALGAVLIKSNAVKPAVMNSIMDECIKRGGLQAEYCRGIQAVAVGKLQNDQPPKANSTD